MIAAVRSAVCIGISAFPIRIEVDVSPGLPQLNVVGLPDQSIKESRERIRAAIKNSGYRFPPDKITINLAPADLKKEGPALDLPMALGILAASGVLDSEKLSAFLPLGELALDGTLRAFKGAIAVSAAFKNENLLLPSESAEEAALVRGAKVYGASSLREVVNFLNGEKDISCFVSKEPAGSAPSSRAGTGDFSEVKGQAFAKRAVEIAVAGGHNLLFIGPPGSGKSMLSQRIPSILPPLKFEEKLEITKIYSVAGLNPASHLVEHRPFRSPHASISQAALVGGGTSPRPGEISLAHQGVLFLDEFPEFRKDVIESLRSPLEDKKIMVSRVKFQTDYPADFMLVAAMNPCPCGYLGHSRKACRCSWGQIQKYQSRISGPVLDRIDLHVEVPALSFQELASERTEETSEKIRERIEVCRKIQEKRNGGILNAGMKARELRQHIHLEPLAKKMAESAIQELGFSARAYYKILKISRTIADLEASSDVSETHVAEALQYRSLDRNR